MEAINIDSMSESPPTGPPTGPPQVPAPLKIPMCGSFCNDLKSGYDFKSIHCKIPGCKSCTQDGCILRIDKVLGEGTYGKVFLVKHGSDGKLYAIKVFNRKSKFQPAAKHEAAILELVRGSPNVIDLIAAFEENNGCCAHFCLLLHCFEMSLYDYFCKNQHVRSSLSEIRGKVRSLLLGLKWFLHEKDVLHCDLKPENVLVDQNGELVICDLGSACFISKPHCGNMTSSSYRAPELMGKVEYGTPSDVWAMGCLLVELLLNKAFFYDMIDSEQKRMQKNIISNIHVEFKKLYSHADVEMLMSFFTLFFHLDPVKRGKIEEILEHPFLRDGASSAASKKRRITGEEPSTKAAKTGDLLDPLHSVSSSPFPPFPRDPFAHLRNTPLSHRQEIDEVLANGF